MKIHNKPNLIKHGTIPIHNSFRNKEFFEKIPDVRFFMSVIIIFSKLVKATRQYLASPGFTF